MASVQKPWKDEELETEAVTKKKIVAFLQKSGNNDFLLRNQLLGTVPNVANKAKKPALIKAYKSLFETKAFRTGKDDEEAKKFREAAVKRRADAAAAAKAAKAAAGAGATVMKKKVDEGPRYFAKTTTKAGDQSTFPRKGDMVEVYYKGMLADGTVFDSLMPAPGAAAKKAVTKEDEKKAAAGGAKEEKKAETPAAKAAPVAKVEPFKFKVGQGRVIRGWDDALLTMSKGEKAKIVITPEGAYGKKGKPEKKIPPNATLTFEVELLNIY